ncbi:MAG: methylated-DNA--[protein]-cysteine S-methyltransferase [Paraglaciecola sp.]|uniref:MGMT family protein n=1 Tax=Paraglaciecola sp. TaxID=1920173 RepID=UPI00273DDE70|nr:methylated-DNA--[protein]-cysteine S-methyltransferase [Paraglaciecola sp.]MDP5031153.1 methylated-DNA--[protein]-cysteine S-methyltransferase [Paraglaciecola sp.]MDP5132118.1 methylated-DNA--[protein]-cysteine S-methyltransferase [Paraglaciecola sp.]
MVNASSKYNKIWLTVQCIPFGTVATYGQIADLAGLPGSARLVGKALGLAPKNLKVNWHRVLRSNGQIAFPSGSSDADTQRDLLLEENVAVINYRVNLKVFQWQPNLTEMLIKLRF